MPADIDPDLLAIVTGQPRGILSTLKRDGRPQQSIIAYAVDEAAGLIRISVTDGRAKTRNLRRDPRASLFVAPPDLRAYAVVEGTVELTPVTTDAGDATADELVEVYRAIGGEHPDWAEYRAAMVSDQRLIVRLSIDNAYGWAPQS